MGGERTLDTGGWAEERRERPADARGGVDAGRKLWHRRTNPLSHQGAAVAVFLIRAHGAPSFPLWKAAQWSRGPRDQSETLRAGAGSASRVVHGRLRPS